MGDLGDLENPSWQIKATERKKPGTGGHAKPPTPAPVAPRTTPARRPLPMHFIALEGR